MKNNFDTTISKKSWEKFYKTESHELLGKDKQAISHAKFLKRFKKDYEGKKLLDLGCGIAKTTALAVTKKTQVVGLDISKEAVKKSVLLYKAKNLNGKFVQGNFLKLPFKNNTFDFIYWGLAIEYVDDTQKAVDEAYRVLKKGGKIISAFPVISLTNLTYQQLRGDIPVIPGIKNIFLWIHKDLLKGKFMRFGYGQTFRTEYIKNIFEKSKFKVKKINYFDTYYPINFVPSFLRDKVRELLRYRLFWPFAYIEAIK